MSDLTARAIADLKAELAEFRANANRVTESMGSEILRLQGELDEALAWKAELKQRARTACLAITAELGSVGSENFDSAVERLLSAFKQQRTRAEAAEQELREERSNAFDALLLPTDARSRSGSVALAIAEQLSSIQEMRRGLSALNKLAAIRAHLAGVDWKDLDRVLAGKELSPIWRDLKAMVAAAREALEP